MSEEIKKDEQGRVATQIAFTVSVAFEGRTVTYKGDEYVHIDDHKRMVSEAAQSVASQAHTYIQGKQDEIDSLREKIIVIAGSSIDKLADRLANTDKGSSPVKVINIDAISVFIVVAAILIGIALIGGVK